MNGTVGGGFRAGFGGCFGVLAAGALIILGLSLFGASRGPTSDEHARSSRTPREQPLSANVWRFSTDRAPRFRIAAENGNVIEVQCDHAEPSVRWVNMDRISRGGVGVTANSRFTIDGVEFSVSTEGIDDRRGGTGILLNFPETAAGRAQRQRFGVALLRASRIEWRPPREMPNILATLWTPAPASSEISEALSRCGA